MNAERISDRHLRAVDGLRPADERSSLRIRVLARSAATTVAGQHLVACLVNLLCRMTDLVAAIEVDLPEVETRVPLPFADLKPDLRQTMVDLARWAVGNEVAIEIEPTDTSADIWLCIGEDVQAPTGIFSLHALANGWRAWVGTPDHLPEAPCSFTSHNPLGPFLAATLLVGEVFKRGRGITRGRWVEDIGHSLWTGETAPWPELEDGPELAGLSLPAFYLIGAGAVGQGVINLVGATGFSSSYVVTIDDDHHDATNLNRCFVAGVGDQGNPKVDAVANYRLLAGVDGFEFPGTLAEYLRRSKVGLSLALAEQEADDRFDCVLSCVDKGTSRQDVQGLWPRLLMGGSTLGLAAKTNVYDLAAGTACLGCHNPPEDDGERLRQVERQVRNMDAEERRLFLKGVANIDAVLAYLDSAETCGKAGEADFRAFATERHREFSVSFVSMAAAILLASRLFARLLFEGGPNELPPMTSIAFLKGSLEHGRISVDCNCRRCGGNAAESFRRNAPS